MFIYLHIIINEKQLAKLRRRYTRIRIQHPNNQDSRHYKTAVYPQMHDVAMIERK